jgi:hypothetical protein
MKNARTASPHGTLPTAWALKFMEHPCRPLGLMASGEAAAY